MTNLLFDNKIHKKHNLCIPISIGHFSYLYHRNLLGLLLRERKIQDLKKGRSWIGILTSILPQMMAYSGDSTFNVGYIYCCECVECTTIDIFLRNTVQCTVLMYGCAHFPFFFVCSFCSFLGICWIFGQNSGGSDQADNH